MQPTLCSKCKKNVAVVFISRMNEKNEMVNEGLCLKCAAQLGLPQPVEKGHLSVVFFSYKERECGIMVWGDKNAGKERRKQRTTGICKFGKHGAAGSLAAEDRRSH